MRIKKTYKAVIIEYVFREEDVVRRGIGSYYPDILSKLGCLFYIELYENKQRKKTICKLSFREFSMKKNMTEFANWIMELCQCPIPYQYKILGIAESTNKDYIELSESKKNDVLFL